MQCGVSIFLVILLEGVDLEGEVLRLRSELISAVVVVLVGGRGDISRTSRKLFSKAMSSKSFLLALPLSGGSLIGGPGFL